MTRRRPSLLHFVVTVLLACQSLVASAALPYGCASQGFQAVAAAAAPAAGETVHDHCDGVSTHGAVPAHDAGTGTGPDATGGDGAGGPGSSGHGAASCHCLHSNGCAMPSDVSLPFGPGATAPGPLSALDRVEPFLPTEHRPPISRVTS
jgi:hypothetical protein